MLALETMTRDETIGWLIGTGIGLVFAALILSLVYWWLGRH